MSQELKTQEAPITQVRHLLENKKADLAMALPKHLTTDRLLRVVLTACNKTPKLLECTRESLLACVMDCASLGLEPDAALGRAYLIPYGQKCTLVIGYKGLADLAYRSGMVDSLDAFAVHEGDVFGLTLGSTPQIEHVPTLEDPGAFTGAYAVARLKGCSIPKFAYMSKSEIDGIRARSKAANSGPWVTDYEEMAKKTVLRRLMKLLPLSVEFADAISKDQEFEFDVVPTTTVKKPLFKGKKDATLDLPPAPTVEEPKAETDSFPPLDPEPTEPEGPTVETLMKSMANNQIDPAKAIIWLRKYQWVNDDQGFQDLREDQIKAIISSPKSFKKQVEK